MLRLRFTFTHYTNMKVFIGILMNIGRIPRFPHQTAVRKISIFTHLRII